MIKVNVIQSPRTSVSLKQNVAGITLPESENINVSVNQKISGTVELKQSAGLPGSNGKDGKSILSGEGEPQNITGNDGDFYLDTLSYILYGPKQNGEWTKFVNLIPQTNNFVIEAGQNLQAFKVVTTNQDGLLIYSDASILEHIDQTLGFLFNSPEIGELGIVVNEGEITNPGWNWIPQKAIFIGLNGNPTQIATVNGAVFSQQIGYAKSPTTVVVGLGLPIQLA